MISKDLIRKSIAVIAIVAMGLSIVPSTAADAAVTAKLSKSKLSMTEGSSKILKITAKKLKNVTWKSTKSKVAAVAKKAKNTAKVTAKKKGTATIKATVKFTNNKKKTLSCKVTVKSGVNPTTQATATTTPTTPTAAIVTPTTVVNPTVVPATQAPTALPTAEGPTAVPSNTPVPELDENNLAVAEYPTIYADVPDNDIIRVGGTYYMTSTTMNMCPGVPVMKSTDLVHWQIVNYVYDILEDNDTTNLENGKEMYTNGSWASAIRYNEEEGLYYVAFNSNDQGCFYIFTTDDVENGKWTKYTMKGSFHDPGLWLEDGKIYVLTNGNISEVALNQQDHSISKVGDTKTIITKSSRWGLWEGSHIYKHGDYYYVTMIGSLNEGWFRMEVCYRSKDLLSTDWEEQIIFRGSTYDIGTGLGQGGFVDTIYGDWYGFLFQDHNAIGRIPSILALRWDVNGYEDWPMMGSYADDGSFQICNMDNNNFKITKPLTIRLNNSGTQNFLNGDDDFTYAAGEKLNLAWQWNHNPQNDYWSVTDNEGHLRLTTDRKSDNIFRTHNCLTQRLTGPTCTTETKMSGANLKSGDYAGMCAVGSAYGMVGIMCDDAGNKSIFQAGSDFDKQFSSVNASVKLESNDDVYFKVAYDFKTDKATFYYSLDGSTWNTIGKQLSMKFDTATTFMGARTWLFNMATKEAGGYADFDYFKIYK